jgi:putative transposase
MSFDPHKYHRRSIRLRDYDYSQPGAYFVTLCTIDRELLLEDITGGIMQLNHLGLAVQRTWFDLPNHYPHVNLDAMILMPNHLPA